MEKIKADVILVSDIHIIDPQDDRAVMLENLIKILIDSDVKNFILIGDIFDFLLGTSSFFHRKYAKIATLLENLANSGTNVVYLEGNHEFKSSGLKWPGVKYVEEGSYRIDEFDLAVAHGDMIKEDRKYFLFRRFIRSRFVTQIAGLIPGSLLNKLALYISSLSRNSEDYDNVPVKAIADSIERWQINEGAKIAVCGHFHIPYAEKSSIGHFYCMQWWGQRPNALVLKDGKMTRMYMQGSDVVFEPCKSIFSS